MMSASKRWKIRKLWIKVLETGKIIEIVNRVKYSKATLEEIIYRTFSRTPVDLSLLDDAVRSKIENGRIVVGMTRYQTLLGRGYPPAHRTLDLGAENWKYWSSRYRISEIHFEQGRLAGFSTNCASEFADCDLPSSSLDSSTE